MRRIFQTILAISTQVWGRWGGGTSVSDAPLMVVYVENWAGWERSFFVSDLEKYILSRNMPVRNWVLNYAFLTWNSVECRIVPVDTEIDFSKGDPGLYPQTPVWWSPGVTGYSSGSVPALLSLKQKYPYIKILPSIGGWSRSHSFHQCLKTKPDVMVQSTLDVVNSFDFDGIDFDWEYPNCDGSGAKCGCQGEATCQNTPNVAGAGDWERYKRFLEQLRAAFDNLEDKLEKRLYITAALGVNPQIIDGANSIYSIATPYDWICEQDVFDWVNLMTYDFYGPWAAKTGPLAPLYSTPDDIAREGSNRMSIDDSIKRILSKCKRPEKLTIGLPAYGKLWKDVPRGKGTVPGLWMNSSNTQSPAAYGTWESATASFWDIKANFETNPLCKKKFDEISKTATVYCEQNPKLISEFNVFMSYDDGAAWREKMAYARTHGFAGGIVWAASDIGNHSPNDAAELFEGALEGWFGTPTKISPPFSNGHGDFKVPVPWDNFPCPIPYGTNAASMSPIPNACYDSGVNVSLYHQREPWRMSPSSIVDNVGENQLLIHGYGSSTTSTKKPTTDSKFVTRTTGSLTKTAQGQSTASKPTSSPTSSSTSIASKPQTTSSSGESTARSLPTQSSGSKPTTRPYVSTLTAPLSTTTNASPVISQCVEFMTSHGQDSAIITECGILCHYYAGSPWCPSNSGTDGGILTQCVLSMAPYCQQM